MVARDSPRSQDDRDVVLADADRKRGDTWIARAALGGFELRALANGGWIASRWNWSRELAEADVDRWLENVLPAALARTNSPSP